MLTNLGAIVMKYQCPVCLIDVRTHRIVDSNDTAAQLFGCTRQELLSLTLLDLLDISERTRFLSDKAGAVDHWGDGGTWTCRMRDGTPFELSVRFHVMDRNGKLVFFVLATDVQKHPSMSTSDQQLRKAANGY